jgi:hypothetical protein
LLKRWISKEGKQMIDAVKENHQGENQREKEEWDGDGI